MTFSRRTTVKRDKFPRSRSRDAASVNGSLISSHSNGACRTRPRREPLPSGSTGTTDPPYRALAREPRTRLTGAGGGEPERARLGRRPRSRAPCVEHQPREAASSSRTVNVPSARRAQWAQAKNCLTHRVGPWSPWLPGGTGPLLVGGDMGSADRRERISKTNRCFGRPTQAWIAEPVLRAITCMIVQRREVIMLDAVEHRGLGLAAGVPTRGRRRGMGGEHVRCGGEAGPMPPGRANDSGGLERDLRRGRPPAGRSSIRCPDTGQGDYSKSLVLRERAA